MDKMDLDSQRIDSLVNSEPPESSHDVEGERYTDPASGYEFSNKATVLFGTLEIEGVGSYFAFLSQRRTAKTWALTARDIFESGVTQENYDQKVIAVIKAHSTGRLEGRGKTHLLSRLMINISAMVYNCVNSSGVNDGFIMSGEWSVPDGSSFIKFRSTRGGAVYFNLEMAYEGFKLNISQYNRSLPFKVAGLIPVVDKTSKAVLVTNLGVRTAASLFKSMGSRLDWYKKKKYKLICTQEEFRAMMLDFLCSVQKAADSGKTVLLGLDTETTGLHMLDLDPSNPLRDNVVSIPFGWRNNEAYVICTDMYYFSNVDGEEVFPLFTTLFSRNSDFSFQDIELDYEGQHFSFNRKNITVAGWNVMFDEEAFFTEGCDVFFDEDGRQLFFNLDTDLQQGQAGEAIWGSFQISNSLKAQTRRVIGDETLELTELFGPKNEDKYRYLQDPVLALLYGGADADYTRSCVKHAISMTEPALYAQYRKYDMSMIYMMAKAAWRGMPIDTASVKKLGDLVKEDLETLKNFIYHYAWLANRDTLQEKADKIQEMLGLDSPLEAEQALSGDQMFRYPFTPANHKKLLFSMLGYPVLKVSEKSGEPALDKYVLNKLMGPQREHPAEILTQDIVAQSDPTMKLVDKDKFNSDAFPLARVFSTYATLNKEYTSYYKPILENDTEDRMFYDFTLARAATRRILSPGQTMKGSLKKLVIAPPGKIFMSFDASQIEYRHMASLAYIRTKALMKESNPDDWEERLAQTSIARIHAMMQKEEADYHIETAASMTGVRQHEVTSKVRKRYKSIGFGIPYGLGERSMCESLHNGVVNDQTMKETKEILADYKKKQCEIIDLLESTRDMAFIPANISEKHREYLGVGDSHVGIVRNFVGFYRVFILENLTRQRKGRIRRQAGNCIIQGGAAELFRRMLYNFHVGCCKVGIENKIQWLMTVHDELDALVDSDIDIMLLIKVLYENCTLRYDDHIPYYIGINFGANWLDAKADANELPVIMVQRMIKAYDEGWFRVPCDGHQSENLLLLKRHYMCDRVLEELLAIIHDLGHGHVWTEEEAAIVDDKFTNYVVRAYLDVFSKGKTLLEKLQGWQQAREEYGFDKDFLTTKFVPTGISEMNVEGELTDLSLDFDLSLDLLEDSSEEESMRERNSELGGDWFGEQSLFDQNASLDEILVSADSDEYRFFGVDKGKDDTLVENDSPTSAFDVFVSTKYLRTKVLKINDSTYSVLTGGTAFQGKEAGLARELKKKYPPGNVSLMVIGDAMIRLDGVALLETDLDWLDKLLCGA